MKEKRKSGAVRPRFIILWPRRIEDGCINQGALFELLGMHPDNVDHIRYLLAEESQKKSVDN